MTGGKTGHPIGRMTASKAHHALKTKIQAPGNRPGFFANANGTLKGGEKMAAYPTTESRSRRLNLDTRMRSPKSSDLNFA